MRIAVTGAAGALGGQVVRRLGGSGREVVALVRRSARSDEWPGHIEVRTADYADTDALRTAMRGVETLVFVSSDGEAAPMMLHHQNVVSAATEAGVSHVVALSGLDADVESPFCYALTNGYTELLLRESGLAYSVARASIYTEFYLSWLRQARETGELRLPTGEGRISLVSRDDVARCLAALAQAPPTGRVHELTGPAALDAAEIAALAQSVWGSAIRHLPVTSREYVEDQARSGQDPWWTYAFSTMFASVRQQRWSTVTTEVHTLTGSAPIPVQDVLAVHRNPPGTTRSRSDW